MKKKENKLVGFLAEYAISIVLFAAVAVFCVVGMNHAEEKQQAEALRIAEESILRGAVSCYALEGFYPPSYEYLKENYGIRVDEEKYMVFYTVFASNMMPDVTVVEK
ncbi:hypothetical protein [Anaerotignum sp.]|nr:hypothetical protein [Anaerotignum sp.]MBQ7757566.1 hypothetical protein [Anaerotignum sp.]